MQTGGHGLVGDERFEAPTLKIVNGQVHARARTEQEPHDAVGCTGVRGGENPSTGGRLWLRIAVELSSGRAATKPAGRPPAW